MEIIEIIELIKTIKITPFITSIIGGGISFWLFNKGLEKKDKKERENKLKNNFEIEKYFFYNINSIIFYLNLQIESIKKTADNTEDWFDYNLILPLFPELKMTELRELNFKTLFQILVIDREGNEDDKAKDFINIKNCLHNIEDFIKHQTTSNLNPRIELEKQLDNWNQNITKLNQLHNNFISFSPKKDDFLIITLQKYILHKQGELRTNKNNYNIETLYKMLIEPFLKELKTNVKYDDHRLHSILNCLNECKNSYENSKSIRISRKQNLISSSDKLGEIKVILTDSLKSTRKRKKIIK